MDTLRLIVSHQFGARIVGVQLDLIDGRDGLTRGVAEEFFEILDAEVGHAYIANFARGGKFLHFLPGIWSAQGYNGGDREWSKGAYHVLMKSQSGRCLDLSFGSVEDGQCYAYQSESVS